MSDNEWESPKQKKKDAAADGEWEVVDYHEKRRQKNKERANKKEENKKQEDEEKEKKKADAKRFLEQYRSAAAGTQNSMFSDETAYAALLNLDETKIAQKKEKKSKGFNPKEGEILHFDLDDKKDQKKEKKQKPKDTKKQDKQKVNKLPLADVIKKMDVGSLKQQLDSYSSKYSQDQDVLLRAVAEYLETQLNQVNVAAISDQDFAQTDFPLKAFNREFVAALTSTVEKCSEPAVSGFFWFLVSTLLDAQDGKIAMSGIGVRLLIQIIARNRPKALVDNITKISEVHPKSKSIDAKKYATFKWLFHQFSDQFSAGLSAWFHFMLPSITEAKNTAAHIKEDALNYIEAVVKSKRKDFLSDEAAAVLYAKMLEYKHSGQQLEKRLVAHLPHLLDTQLLVEPKKVSKQLFTTLFAYANHAKKEIRDDVLPGLAKLVVHEKDHLKVWLELYAKNIPQTDELLAYITKNWRDLSKKMNGEEMHKFVNTLSQLNKKTRNTVRKAEYAVIDRIQENLDKLQDQVKNFAPKPSAKGGKGKNKGGNNSLSSSAGTQAAIITLSMAAASAGALWYLMNNCCGIDQCRSFVTTGIPELNQIFGCK